VTVIEFVHLNTSKIAKKRKKKDTAALATAVAKTVSNTYYAPAMHVLQR
jgi:hypothetical protein